MFYSLSWLYQILKNQARKKGGLGSSIEKPLTAFKKTKTLKKKLRPPKDLRKGIGQNSCDEQG